MSICNIHNLNFKETLTSLISNNWPQDIRPQTNKPMTSVCIKRFLPFRDAVSDLALHFLAKMKIMVVKDIEREDIEFVCKVSNGHDVILVHSFVLFIISNLM